MSHLSLETLARLVDEQPGALDKAHLDACASCRAELESMREDVAALAGLPDMMPSPASWDLLADRLREEGLMKADITPIRTARPRAYGILARAAAVAAIFLGGALVGRAMQDAPPAAPPQVAANADAVASPPQVTAPQATSELQLEAAPANPASQPVARYASTGNAPAARGSTPAARANDRVAEPETEDEALRALRQAEDRYFNALSSYSQKAGTETSDPTTRLAALEAIVLTTRAALGQAPADPVINGYHLTALAQRDAMLKQIRATPATSW